MGTVDEVMAMNGFTYRDELSNVAALFITACAEMKDEPYLQAVFIFSALETLKKSNGMSEKVDFAISYCGKVLRLDEN